MGNGSEPADARVRWDELRPRELLARLKERPVAYLPLGTLEWHGHHLPLGVDAHISQALLERCARAHGGVLLPPLHLGPDRVRTDAQGHQLVGMDFDETTDPPERLPGNAYWVPDEFFESLVLHLLRRLERAGVKGVFADGHGPSRWQWAANLENWGRDVGLTLVGVTPEREKTWRSQIDHAARNETALMLAARPELVDLTEADPPARGVAGAPPIEATSEEGEEILRTSVERVGEWLRGAGL